MLRRVTRLLKRVPRYIWVIVLAMTLSHTFFWVGALQVDPIFWNVCSVEEQAQLWIPELGLTYRDCFILFFNMTITGFYILVAVVVWLTAEHISLRRR